MSCSQVRRELLEHFAIREELGPRSWPHLDHLESCAECRQEVGIDRALVRQLRRALRERVDGSAPSEASWGLVRRRTVDRQVGPWTARVLHWGGRLSAAAAAGIMLFAVATAPETSLFSGTPSPDFLASSARRAGPLVEEARDWPAADSTSYRAPQADPPRRARLRKDKLSDKGATSSSDLPIPGRMR